MSSVAYFFVVLSLVLLVVVDGSSSKIESLFFDFIVVGSGASGSVVATRLAQTFPLKTVLVIEGGTQGQRAAGGTDFVAAKFTPDPQTGQAVLDPTPYTRYDFAMYIPSIRAAKAALNNTWGINPIGQLAEQTRIIGGNMASNGMLWFIPYRQDIDAWGLPGYSSTELFTIFNAIENATGTQYASSHGTQGPIKISDPNFWTPESIKYYNASTAAGYINAGDSADGLGNKTGITVLTHNTRAGVRESTSVTYLFPALGLPNLFLWPGFTVTRVLFDPIFHTIAIGVEYVDKYGQTRDVFANREVILSAGCLQTPKILYNSGIGPLSVLNAFNKPKLVVNDLIGQNIRNHQRFNMMFSDPASPNPNIYSTPTVADQFASDGTNSIYGNAANVFVSLKVNPSHPTNDVGIGYSIGGSTPTTLFSELFPIAVTLTYNNYANGSVNLTSTDPMANTVYTSNLFLSDDDVNTLALGIIEARRILSFYPNATEIFPGALAYPNVTSLKPLIRTAGGVSCHLYGSVPIGNLSSNSPLDLHMRVRGVSRLRVVDASVVPGLISAGMQALSVVMGEKGAEYIIADNL